MKSNEAIDLLNSLGNRFSSVHVVIPVPEGPLPEDVEKAVQDIQSAGYAAYIESTAIGDQIVVTDCDEGIRFTRNET